MYNRTIAQKMEKTGAHDAPWFGNEKTFYILVVLVHFLYLIIKYGKKQTVNTEKITRNAFK